MGSRSCTRECGKGVYPESSQERRWRREDLGVKRKEVRQEGGFQQSQPPVLAVGQPVGTHGLGGWRAHGAVLRSVPPDQLANSVLSEGH